MKRTLSGLLFVLIAVHPACAETVERAYQAVMHVQSSHAMSVLDRAQHVVGIGAFRGLAIFADGEIAVHRYEGGFDLVDGSGRFHGYALWRFEDGAEIRAAYEGTARNVGAHGFEVNARFHDLSGTDRFSGVSGQGAFAGRRLEPIDKGGSTYLTGTITVTLPD